MTRGVWILLLVLGCTGPVSSAAPTPSDSTASVVSQATSLRYIERVTGGAQPEDTLPMIVAVHGLGDRPENFVGLVENLPIRARVILPAGPTPWGQGHAWMTVRTMEKERRAELAQQTRQAADRVATFIGEVASLRPTEGKPVVTGFSQGGMVSFTLAAHHGDLIQGAVPLAGFLPKGIYPEPGATLAPVRALHGDADTVLPIDYAQHTVQHFQSMGADATLSVYPGIQHSLSAPMRAELFRHLEGFSSRGETAP